MQISAARFFNQVRPDKIATFYLSYLPKTEIIKYAKNKGFLDEKKEGLINAGISENLYHSGGDISKQQLKLFKQFDVLFQLTNVLSKRKVDFIIDKRVYGVFNLIPPVLFIIMKDLFCLFTRKGYVDRAHLQLVDYYFKNIKRMIVKRQYF